jgi:hypothetical protein
MLEMMKERGVTKMAATTTLTKVAEKAPPKPVGTMPRATEVVSFPVREELPVEARLKRQRELIHARRGELKRFLSPHEAPFKPLWPTFATAAEVTPKALPAREEMLALQRRLKRQREIIHARRGELKRFLSPR